MDVIMMTVEVLMQVQVASAVRFIYFITCARVPKYAFLAFSISSLRIEHNIGKTLNHVVSFKVIAERHMCHDNCVWNARIMNGIYVCALHSSEGRGVK